LATMVLRLAYSGEAVLISWWKRKNLIETVKGIFRT